jgi:hypothetical protein
MPRMRANLEAIGCVAFEVLERRFAPCASREQLIGDGALTNSPTAIALVYLIF